MKIKEVPFSWIPRWGYRLDVEPFVGGAVEMRVYLEKAPYPKEPLHRLTIGHDGGIYNGPMFRRNYVESPEHGVPFLTSGSMLRADLSNVGLLSRKDAESMKLSYMRLTKGTTLISCSGSIGRTVYTRPDMEGMWASQDIMKVVPDPTKIPPGYLFAFLSSKFGVPMITSGTYGAIIQHIEPEHISSLPVPRLGELTEDATHKLIEEAASLRAFAASTLKNVGRRFDALVSDVDVTQASPRVTSVLASTIAGRFDAQYHDPVVARIRACLKQGRHTSIGQWCSRVFLPGIFKRIHIDDPSLGAPYYNGAALFWLEPIPKAILSRRTSLFKDVQLTNGTVLVQAFGQEGGLTGRAVWVGRHLDGATTTHMLARLNSVGREESAYLFGFLQSVAAYRQIASVTYGGSIPHFDVAGISQVILPLFDRQSISTIVTDVLAAVDARDDALSAERAARALVETAIEKAA